MTPLTPSRVPAAVSTQVDELSEAVAGLFTEFLETFTDDPAPATDPDFPGNPEVRPSVPVYVSQLNTLKERMRTTLYVNHEHMVRFSTDLAGASRRSFSASSPSCASALRTLS